MSITLELPDLVKEQLGESPEALTRALLEMAAIESYRAGKISHGKVAELLGLSWHEAEVFLRRNGVGLNYAQADLETDRRNYAAFLNDK